MTSNPKRSFPGIRRLCIAACLPLAALLGGCRSDLLNPAGDVAVQQRNLLLISTGLMLLIIIPVMALTILFAWRYRKSNTSARYAPDWDHSTQLELVIWAAPLLIIICLGAITWTGTHLLDPYRPIGRLSPDRAVATNARPLEVQVVALDWKWLFIYPEYGVATVNELAAPVNRPLAFRITSSSVMNSFYTPALAGHIYAMPGMETKLHAVANRVGEYEGFSANYSGAGFSGMRFRFHAMTAADFDRWVSQVKASGPTLDRGGYLALERPSENEGVRRFASVQPGLFDAAVNMCVQPGKMCMGEMMQADAKGGRGLQSAWTVLPLEYDKHARRGAIFGAPPGYLASVCRPGDPMPSVRRDLIVAPQAAGLAGAGLARPGRSQISLLSLSPTGRLPQSPAFQDRVQ